MKNVSRNKFLLCFRPVVDMDFVLDQSKGVVDDHPKKKALTYNSVENKEDKKNSESLIIVQPPKRTFSQVIKAVMFETILAKRVRDRKGLSQDSYRSKHCVSISSQRSLASIDSEIQEVKSNQVLSTSSSLGSNSSCSSSISEPKNLTKPLSDKKKQEGTVKTKKEDNKKCCSNFNTGIYLLLISLTLTILWGKVCAILFTSIWFYFVPRQQAGSEICKPEYVTKLAKTESSRDYKKRVIMEGLLERKPPQRSIKSLT